MACQYDPSGWESILGLLKRFTNTGSDFHYTLASIGEEIRVSANVVVAHPLARRVNNVHKLGVRGVQPVRPSHAVKERPGRVQAGYAANLPAHEPALKGLYTDKKKENKIVLIYKEIQKGAVAKTYMRKGFLIFEEMRKYLVIFEEAVSQT
jgi:hypothetical protein